VKRISSRWRASEDGDSSDDAGDWQPLRGRRRVPTATSSTTARNSVWDYLEESNSSWTLFFRAMGHLGQVWGMLALLYWSLETRDDDLMECLAHPYSKLVSHVCMYTHGCLRGFPILAASASLVLMLRILVQNRIYYSLLHLGYVVDFADCQVMRSTLPWMFSFSMLQGGVHLVLKMVVDPNPIALEAYVRLVRKFVVPGAIFVHFFVRLTEIENTLIPLNKLVERDYRKGLDDEHHVRSGSLPSLSKLQALDERVLCFDARHRDIVGDVMEQFGRAPKLEDILQNILDTYEQASENFFDNRRHKKWGFFRSLWPAAVLVDKRLDRNDPRTRSWLIIFGIISVGIMVVFLFSMCFFISSIYRNILLGRKYQAKWSISTPYGNVVTETVLGNIVLSVHALQLLYFVHKTIRGLFYYSIKHSVTYIDATGAPIERMSS